MIIIITVGTGRTNVELLLKEFIMMGKTLDAEEDANELAGLLVNKNYITNKEGLKR